MYPTWNVLKKSICPFVENFSHGNTSRVLSHTSRHVITQGPEEICLSLEHQNPSKTSEIMGYFDRVDDRVTVSLHILYTANQETEGSQDRLTV